MNNDTRTKDEIAGWILVLHESARRLVQSLCLSFTPSSCFALAIDETSGSTDGSTSYKVPGVHGKKQAGRFSESEQKRIDRERYLLLVFTFSFFLSFSMVVPRTNVPGVHGKKQAGRFSESEQKRIDRERYLLLVFTFSFFFSFRRLSFLSDVV